MIDTTVYKRTTTGGARSVAKEKYAGYAVYDPVGQKIGIAEKVFANPDGEPAYVRVRTGVFRSRSVLIPVQSVETDERGKTLVLK